MKNIVLCLLGIAATLLCGCFSDDYHARAAMKRAREYVVDEMRELNENELDFVRFSNPEWQATPLFTRTAMDKAGWETLSDIPLDPTSTVFDEAPAQQSTRTYGCFVWRFPGTNEVVIVSGTGLNNMRGWYPVRAVRRPIHFGDPGKLLALRDVREHVLQNLPLVHPQDQINAVVTERIRYSPPVVFESAYLDTPPKNQKEYTFLWLSEPQTRCVTVSGYATPEFEKFKIERTMIRPVAEIPVNAKRIGNFTELRDLDGRSQGVDE